MSKVGCDCGDEYANTEVEKINTVFCDCCRKYDWELKLEKAEALAKDLEDAIAAALRIKELWGPSITGDVMENRALYIMLTKFEELVK